MEISIFTALFLIALLVNSLIACLLLFLIPGNVDRYHINSLRYYRSFFILSSFAYLSYALRAFLPLTLSVALTSLFFMWSIYCVVFGTWWRQHKRLHLHRHPAVLHIAIVVILQGAITFYYPHKDLLRLCIIYINVNAVLLYALSLFYREPNKEDKSDRLLVLAIGVAVLGVLVLPISYFASNDTELFLNIILLIQNTVIFILFGSFYYMTFYDSLKLYMKNASVDPVSGLHNRKYFLEQAKKFLDAAERHQFPISIVVCDVDEFVRLDDLYGHFAADDLVADVAKLLSVQTRNEDLLARYGDHKFVALLPQTRLNGAALIAERMRSHIEAFIFEYDKQAIRLTASFGVTSIQQYGDISESLSVASDALREAKEAGKNCVRERVMKQQEQTG